jgi:hypothetical protein
VQQPWFRPPQTAIMASSSHKQAVDTPAVYSHGQDSAVDLQHDGAAEATPTPTPHRIATPPPAHDPIEAAVHDHDEGAISFESDSAFDSGSLLGDETDSLASSILNHRMENGRQYHAYRDGAYWGPNDELAKEILDFAHHMYLLTLDQKLHLAPLRDPQTILDCGTGTGIWAIVSHSFDNVWGSC